MLQKLKQIFCKHRLEILETEHDSIFGKYVAKGAFCENCGKRYSLSGEYLHGNRLDLTATEELQGYPNTDIPSEFNPS